MYGRFKNVLIIALLCIFIGPPAGYSARLKDISTIKGIRQNQLLGYGLVVGLNGSGDQSSTTFTVQALANMLENIGVHVNPTDVKVKNVAAVMVSAKLPPFARIGKKIDVTISSIGDAKSLLGGTLLLTPLRGVDGKVYALAQGPISIGGYSAGGAAGGGVTKNHPTVGRITGGASIEKEIPYSIMNKKEFTIILDNPDFDTASRAANAINMKIGQNLARPVDPGTVKFNVPENYKGDVVDLIARIGDVQIEPDSVAKVVVDEKTGTVVVGENVRIEKVAVAHGNLSIHIKEKKEVSQPAPFSPSGGGALPQQMDGGTIVAPGGSTVVTPESNVSVAEEANRLLLIPKGRTIGELVNALNAIGVTPRDLITILQAIKAAGALEGELEII